MELANMCSCVQFPDDHFLAHGTDTTLSANSHPRTMQIFNSIFRMLHELLPYAITMDRKHKETFAT